MTCRGKVRHPSRAEAGKALRVHLGVCDRNARDRPLLQIYRCGLCGGFHLGNGEPEFVAKVPYKRVRVELRRDGGDE